VWDKVEKLHRRQLYWDHYKSRQDAEKEKLRDEGREEIRRKNKEDLLKPHSGKVSFGTHVNNYDLGQYQGFQNPPPQA
jgi:hypothetical protein